MSFPEKPTGTVAPIRMIPFILYPPGTRYTSSERSFTRVSHSLRVAFFRRMSKSYSLKHTIFVPFMFLDQPTKISIAITASNDHQLNPPIKITKGLYIEYNILKMKIESSVEILYFIHIGENSRSVSRPASTIYILNY
jgi:hypothetical protein